MRIATWNIGSMMNKGMDWKEQLDSRNKIIISTINASNIDILLLQESTSSSKNNYSQSGQIAKSTALVNESFMILDQSHHIDIPDLNTGISILTKYPILNFKTHFIVNPNISVIRPNKDIWYSHQKGILKLTLDINGNNVDIHNLHLLPLRIFKLKPNDEKIRKTWNSLQSYFENNVSSTFLIGGDFNLKDIEKHVNYFSTLQKFSTIEETTSDNRHLDYFFCSNDLVFNNISLNSHFSTFDHYPVFLEISNI